MKPPYEDPMRNKVRKAVTFLLARRKAQISQSHHYFSSHQGSYLFA